MVKDTKSISTAGKRFFKLFPDTKKELNCRSKIEIRRIFKKLLLIHPDSPTVVWDKSRLRLPQDTEKIKDVMKHFIDFLQAVEPLCEEKEDSLPLYRLFNALFSSDFEKRTIQRKMKEALDEQKV